MKVLITGGAGYIGSHINQLFQREGIETVIIDDLSNGHEESIGDCENFYYGDFGDKMTLNIIMSKHKIDAVVHCGAFASVPDSVINPEKYYDNNVYKMKILLDECINHNIKYFVFSSSASTFGNPISLPINETHPQNPINPYGRTKLIGEYLLEDYERAYGIKFCIFRYFCAAGASLDASIGESHSPETHLIPVMIKAALNNTTLKVFGNDYNTRDGSCIRDFIHVEDLSQAHLLGLKYIMENDISDDFNLGSGTGFTIFEMINHMEKLGYPVKYEIANRREGDPSVLVAANTKAKNILNWIPEYSNIDQILLDAITWEKNRRY